MKWINLSERQPNDLTKVLTRRIATGESFLFTKCRYSYDDDGIKAHLILLDTPFTANLYLKDVEWLDESVEDGRSYPFTVNKNLEVERLSTADTPTCKKTDSDGNVIEFEFYMPDRVDRLLAEQHINTIYDAVYKIQEYCINRKYVDINMSEVGEIVLNLKQRKPE